MEYDVTDYSMYLETERDELLAAAIVADRSDDEVNTLLLEMEVMYMLEMV